MKKPLHVAFSWAAIGTGIATLAVTVAGYAPVLSANPTGAKIAGVAVGLVSILGALGVSPATTPKS